MKDPLDLDADRIAVISEAATSVIYRTPVGPYCRVLRGGGLISEVPL